MSEREGEIFMHHRSSTRRNTLLSVKAVVNLIRRLPLSGNIQGNVRKITRQGSAVGMEERKAALR